VPREIIPLVASWWRMIRKTCYFVVDTIDVLLCRRDELTPPKRIFLSYRDFKRFKKVGEEFLQYFIESGGLKPHERILDVGSGVGRMAIPLTKYLDERGRYEGFDPVADEIKWCKKKISSKFPNFHFQSVDIYNKTYNPKGRWKASEFKFPYENEFFDFAFLASVFTHMLPQDMENYFREVARVLKRGGRCLITFFLLNKESLQLINARKSILDFKYEFGEFRTTNPDKPEDAVCYDETFICGLYQKYGLRIKFPIHYGSWCGRRDFLSSQDIIVAIKD
jgi:ubiquinone/menaquinone biosynthesis C-methylase UbiE